MTVPTGVDEIVETKLPRRKLMETIDFILVGIRKTGVEGEGFMRE